MFVIRDKTLLCNVSRGRCWLQSPWQGLEATLAMCIVPVEHSWAGALWLSGLKQILLTHNVVSQYHSKSIWHAILSMSLMFISGALSNKGREKKKAFKMHQSWSHVH